MNDGGKKMCGIIGYAGESNSAIDVLLNGISNLEYRGYDSAGVVLAGTPLEIIKRKGEVDELKTAVEEKVKSDRSLGVGHTRWSTHGAPSKRNAHPHVDCENSVAVVHNGIIDNYQDLVEELKAEDHILTSDTDTEVVPHLLEHYVNEGFGKSSAIRKTVERLEGSYSLGIVFEGETRIHAVRQESPLVIGLGNGRNFLASDVPAFREYTDEVIYLDDGEIAQIMPDNVEICDSSNTPIKKEISVVEWEPSAARKGGYDHYMLKEINEQPHALDQCMRTRISNFDSGKSLDALSGASDIARVEFVACGTSYYAAKYGSLLLRQQGIPSAAFLASEYIPPTEFDEDTFVIGVTQSGETADTLTALRSAKRHGAQTIAMTNVIDSSVTRECDESLYIRAGPEIGVAATKTFATQLATIVSFALHLRHRRQNGNLKSESRDLLSELRMLPTNVETVLEESTTADIASEYLDSKSYFFIGRGLQFPVALEGALKMKEITYKHAEGFAAGELKHGPLALVTERTPVFVAVTGTEEVSKKTFSNMKEAASRGAPIVMVTDGALDAPQFVEQVVRVPRTHPQLSPILVNTQFQLLAYHTARELHRPIDKPRNLAKSVTVE